MAAPKVSQYKLVFFVPESHKEQVKSAVFSQGAGKYDHYEQCAWETSGQGQFKPLPGSNAFIGEVAQLSTVAEYRVEILCPFEQLKAVLTALIDAHPYETPAYEVWPVFTIDDF